MTLQDFLDATNIELEITRYSNQDGRWCARFAYTDKMEPGVLVGSHGNGKTPVDAVNNYLSQVRGQRIAVNVGSKEYRREYQVPTSIPDLTELQG